MAEWTHVARSFALRFNPALQSRALVVFSCLSKVADEATIKQLLALLVQVRYFIVYCFRRSGLFFAGAAVPVSEFLPCMELATPVLGR